jgi:hypothetical protein
MPTDHDPRSGATSDGMALSDIVAALQPDPDRLIVRNEFAAVSISLCDPGPGRSRLRITDLSTGQAVELDALELESLAWARHQDLSPLLDPSQSRWPGADNSPRTGKGRSPHV